LSSNSFYLSNTIYYELQLYDFRQKKEMKIMFRQNYIHTLLDSLTCLGMTTILLTKLSAWVFSFCLWCLTDFMKWSWSCMNRIVDSHLHLQFPTPSAPSSKRLKKKTENIAESCIMERIRTEYKTHLLMIWK